MSIKFKLDNLDDLIKLYRSGMSMKQLSLKTGIQRSTLRRHFVSADVDIRGRSEAEGIKWAALKLKGRRAIRRQCGAAWKARRGSRDHVSVQMARARTRYLRMTHVGAFEDEIAIRLRKRGLDVRQQFPYGPYNLDIALHRDRIAVEITKSTNLPMSPKLRKRTKSFFDGGWFLIQILVPRPPFDGRAVTDQIISIYESFGGLEPRPRKYWVIRGDGQGPARCGDDSDACPVIWCPKSSDEGSLDNRIG